MGNAATEFPDDEEEASEGLDSDALKDLGVNEDASADDAVLPDDTEDLAKRIQDLEDRINSFPIPQQLFPVFPVRIGTDNSWQELVVLNGSLNAGGARSFISSDTASGASLISLTPSDGFVVETKDPPYTRFLVFSGGGSAGTNQYASITSVIGTTSDVEWVYQLTLPGGGTSNGYNGFESGGAIAGSPGSLGIDVGSDGSVTGTSCFIHPIGPVPVVLIVQVGMVIFFSVPNSAG